MELAPPDLSNPDADAEVWLEDGEWRMERAISVPGGILRRTRAGFASRRTLLHRLGVAHCAYPGAGAQWWLPAARLQRNTQWQGILVLRLVGGGQDHHGAAGALDVTLLTDELPTSARSAPATWPTALLRGEFGEPGKNVSAPIAAVYLLEKAAENRIVPVEPAAAVRRLMRNVLFLRTMPT